MKQTILVMGGAGFLGSHLCDRFLAEGFAVIAMDNLITGSTDNIAHLVGRDDFRFIHHDVTEFIYLQDPVYAVVHFASPASPLDYHELPIQTLKVGSLGTHKALGLSLNKRARFLLASTSEVYGDPLIHPQPETYWGNVNPVGPRGVYDEAKRFAEALTMAYQRFHGVDTRIARIFNTFGPRMRLNDGRAIPAFITQALRGEPLTVFGDGKQTRSLLEVRGRAPRPARRRPQGASAGHHPGQQQTRLVPENTDPGRPETHPRRLPQALQGLTPRPHASNQESPSWSGGSSFSSCKTRRARRRSAGVATGGLRGCGGRTPAQIRRIRISDALERGVSGRKWGLCPHTPATHLVQRRRTGVAPGGFF